MAPDRFFCILGFAAGLTVPAAAQAAVNLSLSFTGTASPGFYGELPTFDPTPLTVSFAGQPVTLNISIVGDPGDLYVDQFSVSWSNQTYSYPVLTSLSDVGFPAGVVRVGAYSTVDLTANGGSIRIYSTGTYNTLVGGDYSFDVDYALSSPHSPYSSFTDAGVTGQGSVDVAFFQSNNYAIAHGGFTLSSLTQVSSVPEPDAWAVLILGLGAIGLGARLRRRRPKTFAGPPGAVS